MYNDLILTDMDVKIENLFFGWHEKLPETFIRLVNTLVLTRNGKEVREAMATLAQDKDFNGFFLYGFGRRHLWVKQKGVPTIYGNTDYRLLIVEF